MKRTVLFILIVFATYSCRNGELRQVRAYYRSELAKRNAAARDVCAPDTAVLKHVHDRVAAIILLSKDIENFGAAVNRSRSLFDSLSAAYELNRSDFQDLHTGLSPLETEILLLENELAFADRLIMQHDTTGEIIFTAH